MTTPARNRKKTSEAQVEARADGEEAQAKMSGAPPSSQTTLNPQSLCEYSAMLSMPQPVSFLQGINSEDWSIQDAQLKNMENGMLQKPAQKQEDEELARVFVETERPRQPLQAAQPRPCPPVEGAGGDEMGDLGEEQVVAGCEASVEEQRFPFWEDRDNSVWWPVPDEAERVREGGEVVVEGGILVLEDGEFVFGGAPEEKSCLEPAWMGTEWLCSEPEGNFWERAGIGTGARSRAFWGCEAAERRLTQLRRAQVREK